MRLVRGQPAGPSAGPRAPGDVSGRHPPCPGRSVVEWARHPEARALRIAEINLIEGLHEALCGLPGHVASDYREGPAPGGLPSEDLTRLTYSDAAFDLVLTSETLEHVPDLDLALRELRRVLVPGGRHLFTVPAHARRPGDLRAHGRRARRPPRTSGPSPLPPGRRRRLSRLHRVRGRPARPLACAGFEVTIHFGPTTEDDLAQVFICRI